MAARNLVECENTELKKNKIVGPISSSFIFCVTYAVWGYYRVWVEESLLD